MKAVSIPGRAVEIAVAARPLGQELVVLEQLAGAVALTMAAGGVVVRIATDSRPGPDRPLAFNLAELAGGAAGSSSTVQVIEISPELAAVVPAAGIPTTVTLEVVNFGDVEGLIDAVEGEAASGMTKAVVHVSPLILRQIAATAEALGSTAVELVVAPRLGSMLVSSSAPGCTACVVISLDGQDRCQEKEKDSSALKSLVFKVQATPRRGATRCTIKKPERLSFEDDLPF